MNEPSRVAQIRIDEVGLNLDTIFHVYICLYCFPYGCPQRNPVGLND